VTRTLADDTLVVFVSDTHIGGDADRDVFESQDELASLFEALDAHGGPVELVLAGDFFDFLRISHVGEGATRASATIEQPEYRALFAALRRFAAGEGHTVTYLPGNHDAEAWWNPEIQADLRDAGLVHGFALSYAVSFASEPSRTIYCEHGNQFDPTNAIHDYEDPLDTPLGDHVVTDLAPRLVTAGGWARLFRLREIDRLFPLAAIPEWLVGRLYYALVTLSVVWLLLPLLVWFVGKAILDEEGGSAADRIVDLAIEIGFLLVLFGVFVVAGGRLGRRVIRSFPDSGEGAQPGDAAVAQIRGRLERGEAPPLADGLPGEISVFVSGHTHAPSLAEFDGPAGTRGALVNSGCWMRQLQPVTAHLRAPAVFASRFVQTHVRVYRDPAGIQVELWEHPRPSPQRLGVAERVAIAGRLPPEPDRDSWRQVRARTAVALTPESAGPKERASERRLP
jgi:UDP-2,3-diacylglucosamine pyrophosphatase LpxH